MDRKGAPRHLGFSDSLSAFFCIYDSTRTTWVHFAFCVYVRSSNCCRLGCWVCCVELSFISQGDGNFHWRILGAELVGLVAIRQNATRFRKLGSISLGTFALLSFLCVIAFGAGWLLMRDLLVPLLSMGGAQNLKNTALPKQREANGPSPGDADSQRSALHDEPSITRNNRGDIILSAVAIILLGVLVGMIVLAMNNP